jgi:hypothetical protein
MSVARSRLAALAAAAGYPPDLLKQIAEATLPGHTGRRLRDPQIRQLTEAVDVLVQNGYTASTVGLLLDDYQRRHGERWRERFWTNALRIANHRHQHPELHGDSNAGAAATAAR